MRSGRARHGISDLVDEYMGGGLPLDHFVSRRFEGIASIPDAIDSMHSGDVLRAVVSY